MQFSNQNLLWEPLCCPLGLLWDLLGRPFGLLGPPLGPPGAILGRLLGRKIRLLAPECLPKWPQASQEHEKFAERSGHRRVRQRASNPPILAVFPIIQYFQSWNPRILYPLLGIRPQN